MTCPNALSLDLSKLSAHCYIQQFATGCLAQYTYYIESDKVAVIIDPLRDIDSYLKLIKERGSKLKYIIETHFHADFVSGHVDLASKTGAEIVYGPEAQAEFKILSVKHEEVLDISDKVKIQVLHTPGHTLESSCFLLYEKQDKDNKQIGVFTGDTLFLGDIGRPDLSVKSDLTSKDLACYLYESIQLLKKVIVDDCVIFPAHGAGSACGKNIQAGSYSNMAIQKKTNYALSDNLKRREFIEIATANIPTPPQYFFFDAMLNHKLIANHEDVLKKSLTPIDVDEFAKFFEDKSIVVLDTREVKSVYEGFISGSILISLDIQYAIWTATLFTPDTKIAIIAPEGREEEAVSRLMRVGFDNVVGYLKGGFKSWSDAKKPIDKLILCPASECVKTVEENRKYVLDVRNQPEFVNFGIIKEAQRSPLPMLEANVEKINKTDKIFGLCRAGVRAIMAACILKKHGFKNEIVILEGGFDNLVKNGFQPDKLE
jgi:hydroxyacylglutathione hydrolase